MTRWAGFVPRASKLDTSDRCGMEKKKNKKVKMKKKIKPPGNNKKKEKFQFA